MIPVEVKVTHFKCVRQFTMKYFPVDFHLTLKVSREDVGSCGSESSWNTGLQVPIRDES